MSEPDHISPSLPGNVDATLTALESVDYVCPRGLAVAVYLALTLRRPLFLEGEAGVGKTEIAKALATLLQRNLIRLQCYEGLDINSAVYEWNYPAQMIAIKAADAHAGVSPEDVFREQFLIERPLLKALRGDDAGAPVLLIDELDRADEPFEAFLLEVLSDWQVTIPELGTITAATPPIVIITSNRTREIHDAIKRRCFYYWVDYPSAQRELMILNRRVPGIDSHLSRQIVAFVQKLRGEDFFKLPGIAETIDWAQALSQLEVVSLDPEIVQDTVGVLLKYQDDIARLHGSEAARLINEIRAEAEVCM